MSLNQAWRRVRTAFTSASGAVAARIRRHRKGVKRAMLALAVIVVTAIVTAIITSERVDSAFRSVTSVFRSGDDQLSESEWVTNKYFKQTREANIWQAPPLILPPSKAYYLRHFRQFDPRRKHLFYPRGPVIPVPALVTDFPLFAGAPVTVVGKVKALQVAGPPLRSQSRHRRKGRVLVVPNVEYIAQLSQSSDLRSRGPIVYCRFAESVLHRLPEDGWAAVTGVPIAGGNIIVNEGGATPGAYLACSAVLPIQDPETFVAATRRLRMQTRRDHHSG